MNLAKYYGKRVKIETKDGTVFVGDVNDYFEPEDNENGQESIIVDTAPHGKRPIEFYPFDIDSIAVVEKQRK